MTFIVDFTWLSSIHSTIMFFTPLFFLVCSFIVMKKIVNKTSRKRFPPGPIPLPFFGNLIPMVCNKPTFRWIDRLMDQMQTQILDLRFGKVHVIVVRSPEIAREFLKSQDAVFTSRPDFMSGHLASGGYLATTLVPVGDQWKKMKKVLVSDILLPSRHQWLQPKRDEESNDLIRYVHKQCQNVSGGVVNVRNVTRQYAGNIIRKMIFGRKYFGKGGEDGGPGREEIEHVDSLFEIHRHLYAFCISDYLPWLRWTTDFDGHEKRLRKAINDVCKYQDHLVDIRLKEWKAGFREEDDLLDVLIRHKNPALTPEEIKAQILDMMLAAIDNPSNCTEWVIAEMLNNPQILQKAVEELDNVVGKERLVQESDLPKLSYLRACAKEGFRLHPISPFNLPHESIADTTVAGFFIPKGSHVLLSRTGLGRNPQVWEDPRSFIPERHLSSGHNSGNEITLTDHGLHMISFSTGRRGCPASMLGSTMTVMLMARLVQGFTWEVPPTEHRIDLSEGLDSLCKAKPLLALAKPRLPEHLYA